MIKVTPFENTITINKGEKSHDHRADRLRENKEVLKVKRYDNFGAKRAIAALLRCKSPEQMDKGLIIKDGKSRICSPITPKT